MPTVTRMTIAFDESTPARLKEVAVKFGVSYARLISCLLQLPDETIKKAIDDNYATMFMTAAEKRKKDKELLDMVKQLSSEELAAILAAAKQGA